jgi:predicted amidophosphoribosyltransferase
MKSIGRPDHIVFVESRRLKTVTCPHCWTEQRTDRDFCYRCGAAFVYLDKAEKNTPA